MSEKLLEQIFEELKNMNNRIGGLEQRFNGLEQRFNGLEQRFGDLETGQKDLVRQFTHFEAGQKDLVRKFTHFEAGQKDLVKQVKGIDTELKEFRTETKTSLKVIQTGQQGTREEMTQRFKEVKHTLNSLESDIALTFQKTAQQELELNRIKNQ
ncbi:hypothetical protein [Caldibacillus thermoamylovorans]|uniref:Chromosome partition protein Smc n=1 Tax=Caldibacillus thermoamylovorans TaxID=35841 RepID=A0ABD4A4S8_9BACI|nr:hypothetical protein [Caldibacillus thermoamylovorans]KIO69723.1 hypothetical protein B4166_0323 [Caldibacillus thermoamylovorans]KIO71912.1 hypothetical protein B4167_0327 [Caldibacillus thermoamylovorans]